MLDLGGIVSDSIVDGPGIRTTVFSQGCPHHCPGCHNPETWDFEGGLEFKQETLDTIIEALTANGIKRNFCIMGGEPLCADNIFLTNLVINYVKEQLPETKIYVWSGYTLEELKLVANPHLKNILSTIDCLIDGPYIESQRDITLSMRGSKNQRVIYFDKE